MSKCIQPGSSIFPFLSNHWWILKVFLYAGTKGNKILLHYQRLELTRVKPKVIITLETQHVLWAKLMQLWHPHWEDWNEMKRQTDWLRTYYIMFLFISGCYNSQMFATFFEYETPKVVTVQVRILLLFLSKSKRKYSHYSSMEKQNDCHSFPSFSISIQSWIIIDVSRMFPWESYAFFFKFLSSRSWWFTNCGMPGVTRSLPRSRPVWPLKSKDLQGKEKHPPKNARNLSFISNWSIKSKLVTLKTTF